MRVLVTNDDGLSAPGLRALAVTVAREGHDVTVIAPLDDRSGAGTGLNFDRTKPLDVRRETMAELPGVRFVGVDGTPALAVLLARLEVFAPRPFCVVSGINFGANTGRAILHSGTVGAALTAATMGMSGLAVSIAAPRPVHLATAAKVAGIATNWLTRARKRTVLNLNVPDLPFDRLRGVRCGRLAAFGGSRLVAVAGPDGTIRVSSGESSLPLDLCTDAGLVAAGYVSVTQIDGPAAAADDSAANALDDLVRAHT
jgi:5'-nucleotidase